jgi:predicted DNA-binding protein YlxM (UPF0122 family)
MKINEYYHRLQHINPDVLTPFQKIVFSKFHYDNMTVREIAKEYSTPIETVVLTLNRIISKLIKWQDDNISPSVEYKFEEGRTVGDCKLIMSEI